MTNTHYTDCTADFMRRMGLTVPEPEPNSKTEALRLNLIGEELFETHKAMAAGDLIETADGFADLLYVIAGAAATYGVSFDVPNYTLTGPPRSPNAEDASAFLLEMLPALNLMAVALSGTDDDITIDEALSALGDVLAGHAAGLDLPLPELFDEVHRSNSTKDAAPAAGSVDYGKRGGKGLSYSPPDIAKVLRNAGWEVE